MICLVAAEKKSFDRTHGLFMMTNSQQTQNKREIPQSVKTHLPATQSQSHFELSY